jgi:hypothetical protein
MIDPIHLMSNLFDLIPNLCQAPPLHFFVTNFPAHACPFWVGQLPSGPFRAGLPAVDAGQGRAGLKT